MLTRLWNWIKGTQPTAPTPISHADRYDRVERWPVRTAPPLRERKQPRQRPARPMVNDGMSSYHPMHVYVPHDPAPSSRCDSYGSSSESSSYSSSDCSSSSSSDSGGGGCDGGGGGGD